MSYNAFDPELQMWVGACMYKGVVDIYKIFVGEVDDQAAEQLFEEGIALGTMLQVPREMWPADQAAFDRYWEESMAEVHIDDEVRDFLWPIAAGRVRGAKLPASVQRRLDDFNLLITGGFLPQRFRDEMRLEWDDEKQRRFDRLMKRIRFVNDLLPGFLRAVSLQLDDEGSRVADADRPSAGLAHARHDAVDVNRFRNSLEMLWAKVF